MKSSHMLSLSSQAAAYSWRGTGYLSIALLIALGAVVGIPYVSQKYWASYLDLWQADQHPIAFFCARGLSLQVQCIKS